MIIILVSLFNIQILNNDYYKKKVLEQSKTLVYSNSTPRGRIYDRYGRIIVDNEAVKVIYYKKPSNITTEEEIKTAYKVAELIDIDYSNLSDKNLKKFWIKNNPLKAKEKITDEEWILLEERKLTLADIEQLKLDRITEEEINALTTIDYEAAYIYYLMNVGYSYDEKIIKKVDVSDSEYALIAENKSIIPGFDVMLDWNRVYPYGDTLKTILGSVSTTETGIPYELKDYYLSLGYSLNDRVGTSYLEYQYESILKGEKTVYELLSDGSKKIVSSGSRGNDIMLTIDIELQQEVEKILESEIIAAQDDANTKYYNSSFAIISNPNTGEILALAGKQLSNGKIYDYTSGIITIPVTAGSIVKGASHTVGYVTGNIQIGERRKDECIKIASTPLKCSWTTLGTIDDISALKYSSNVYQFQTAIKVGGGSYKYDEPLAINEEAFDIYRSVFAEYGLGVYTGIDLPNESLGYQGMSKLAGYLLDFSIGQYDTYTPIQLMQYINTIANGGYRLKPYLLKAVYNPTNDGLTSLAYENEKTILNKVNIEDKYMERIRAGFREVMTSGTGSSYINSIYNAAGKTGTSESFIDTDNDGIVDTETMSNTFGAYAPYDNPTVSFLVVSPNVYYKEDSTTRSGVNKRISYRISQKYFEIYK
jgi:cell division protein FtsI/penicillin-binding protein 2